MVSISVWLDVASAKSATRGRWWRCAKPAALRHYTLRLAILSGARSFRTAQTFLSDGSKRDKFVRSDEADAKQKSVRLFHQHR
jgi:hypothetical protein